MKKNIGKFDFRQLSIQREAEHGCYVRVGRLFGAHVLSCLQAMF